MDRELSTVTWHRASVAFSKRTITRLLWQFFVCITSWMRNQAKFEPQLWLFILWSVNLIWKLSSAFTFKLQHVCTTAIQHSFRGFIWLQWWFSEWWGGHSSKVSTWETKVSSNKRWEQVLDFFTSLSSDASFRSWFEFCKKKLMSLISNGSLWMIGWSTVL